MITVQVNQKEHQVASATTVVNLINQLKIQTNGIAIAINNRVVKKTDWNVQQLQQNDVVLIIKSTQGG
ncbi:sulfur carrier protein ThiS [Polaribacter sp. WD7]|uniref:sulfur carrier protein ThiS n=1 Tax=Polaribacter sp. WD7 TaxID=2269061 RepID=UPI000DF3766A|nr:sulfur carrier protein ThiS [Polaribacter sp. WD7]RCS26995.1 sulfur carrier protein ThiS [Polaribacter sp. WD7]